MFPKRVLVLVVVLASLSLACNLVTSRFNRVETGPVREEPIEVDSPDAADTVRLYLNFAAGELRVSSGAGDRVVSGMARYNVEELKPDVVVGGNEVTVETGDLSIEGIPAFRDNLINEWDLQLGEVPIDLTIGAGAYQGRIDLGGLSITNLDVTDGASDVELEFSEPNQVQMDEFRYETGASNVELSGLANANFSDMTFRGGAGNYTLEFDGNLERDADVQIDVGVCQLTLIVPDGVSARLEFEGGLSNVDVQGGWSRSGNLYTVEGDEPTINVHIDMGAGNLQLRTR